MMDIDDILEIEIKDVLFEVYFKNTFTF